MSWRLTSDMRGCDVREIWKSAPGWDGLYEVSNLGRVRSVSRTIRRSDGRTHPIDSRIIKQSLSRGYPRCSLSRSGKTFAVRVHILVAAAFKGPRPPGHDVRHKDGLKTNVLASNLKYGTRSQNENDKVLHGVSNRGERCGSVTLTREQVLEIRKRYSGGGISQLALGLEYGVTDTAVYHIIKGKTWAWL